MAERAAGRVVRTTLGSPGYVISASTAPPLLLDFVEKGDIYSHSEQGTIGFQQEYRIAPDGTPVLYRAKIDAHVSAFATDGATMFWVESYGGPNPKSAPTTIDVWAAPYTSDSATLSATARKLVSSLQRVGPPEASIAFGGLFAFWSPPNVIIVRASDGAFTEVPPPAGLEFYRLAFVTPTELWATSRIPNRSGGVTFRRMGLGTW